MPCKLLEVNSKRQWLPLMTSRFIQDVRLENATPSCPGVRRAALTHTALKEVSSASHLSWHAAFFLFQVAEDYNEMEAVRPQSVSVNLDPSLLLLPHKIHYLSQQPLHLKMPAPARGLLRSSDCRQLRVAATRLETVVSKYNSIMKPSHTMNCHCLNVAWARLTR